MENMHSFSAYIVQKPWIVIQLVFEGNYGELIS